MRTYELTWPDYADPYMVPNGSMQSANRVRTITADRYEVTRGEAEYPRVEFYIGEEIVATLFSFPMMITATQASDSGD